SARPTPWNGADAQLWTATLRLNPLHHTVSARATEVDHRVVSPAVAIEDPRHFPWRLAGQLDLDWMAFSIDLENGVRNMIGRTRDSMDRSFRLPDTLRGTLGEKEPDLGDGA